MKSGVQMSKVKEPKTYDEQLDILISKGLTVENREFCLSILQQLNYYRLTAYMLPFKVDDDRYSHISFEKVYAIYEFDRRLRMLTVGMLEEIELVLRTKFAYFHAHRYGALGLAKELGCPSARHLTNWIHCLTVLRNKCAHYMRLYYTVFTVQPRISTYVLSCKYHKLYSYISVAKQIYPDKTKWERGFFNELSSLIYQYSDDITLSHIGFPVDWEQQLRT